jgi:cytosine permease
MGTFTAGDFNRYAKKPRDAATAITVCLVPAIPAVLLSGAVFRILEGTHDITVILSGMGFPTIALVFLVLTVWMTNMSNAYSGGIAISVLLGLPEKRLWLGTAITGGVGTLLGAAGILSRFTGFLGMLSSLVPPVIGVLMGVRIADMLGRRGIRRETGHLGQTDLGNTRMKPGFHLPGIIAYAAGAIVARLTSTVWLFLIPPLNGIVVAAAAYVILKVCVLVPKTKS